MLDHLSIVENNKNSSLLHVRARKEGDIEAVFPDADVLATPYGDYKFRADMPREMVAKSISDTIRSIDYTNFKDSVDDEQRHEVYMGLWSSTHGLEESF